MKVVIDVPNWLYFAMLEHKEPVYSQSLGDAVRDAVRDGTSFPKELSRKFEEIVVEYPPEDLCTYPEYRGKPYFSIKYEENGEHHIGFGTYKPEVLSQYLSKYFIQAIIKDKENKK